MLALSSVTIGFVSASAFTVTINSSKSIKHLLLTILTTTLLFFYKKINPIWIIGIGAVLGKYYLK